MFLGVLIWPLRCKLVWSQPSAVLRNGRRSLEQTLPAERLLDLNCGSRQLIRNAHAKFPQCPKTDGVQIMFTYTCCRCTNCAAEVVLEDRADSDTEIHRPPRPRTGHESCPHCRAVFLPENYYVKVSQLPLLMRAEVRDTRNERQPHR